MDHICYLSYPVMTNGSSMTPQLLVVLTLAQIANMKARDDVDKSPTKVN